ncbi:MAG: ribokinase [Chloroflexi bacterium]|nr:MAG: ribokinase [Chloroflexota bacterium]
MSAIDYLLIGHMTADLTPEGRRLGGTVSYAARTAHAFGLRVGVLTSAAVNEPLLDEIRPYAEVVSLEAEATSTFENIYTPEGRQQYIRGVANKITVADIPEVWRTTPYVHLAPLTGEVDPDIVFAFPNATKLLTLQGWLRYWEDDGLVQFKRFYDEHVLSALDIVVFSEEDIREAPDMEAQYAAVVKNLIVTRAAHGGTYYHQGQPFNYSTPQVEEVNPTGAGDVFASALLAALSHVGGDMHKALQVAAQLGAIAVTRFFLEGAPTPDEVQKTLMEIR